MKPIHALAAALALTVGVACESAPAEENTPPTPAAPAAPVESAEPATPVASPASTEESPENVFVSAERPEVRYYLIADT